jgi:RNA-directed DNA polymerase
VQEGGWVKTSRHEEGPAAVPKEAKQARETRLEKWAWVERTVWTDRMLEALKKGVKGVVWFSLIDKVYRPETLHRAWLKVKANKGGPGTDHQSVEGFERDLERNLNKLHEELRTGSYQPRAILRTYIDKPGSREKRPLGIPCVRDRVVQTAVRFVMEPIFEQIFHAQSYGFRPELGCKDALREVDRLLKAGYGWIVDADVENCFGSIPHEPLLREIRQHIGDGRMLGLLEAFLKQGVMEGLAQWTPEEGTPQGAVISPLLANIYLNPVDGAMAKAGYRMVRYADDFVILCRSREKAEDGLIQVQQQMTDKGLRIHPEKTRLVNVQEPGQGFDFLGYRFEGGTRRPRAKSLKKLKDAIRKKTGRSNGHAMEYIIANVNGTVRGWFEYFKHSNKRVFPRLDQWIRRRLRSILRRRHKCKGISRGYDHYRWPNRYFQAAGLFNLEEAHCALLQSSRGKTTDWRAGCGRSARPVRREG